MVVHDRFSYWLGHPFTSTVTQGDDDDKGSEKEDEKPNWFIEGTWLMRQQQDKIRKLRWILHLTFDSIKTVSFFLFVLICYMINVM